MFIKRDLFVKKSDMMVNSDNEDLRTSIMFPALRQGCTAITVPFRWTVTAQNCLRTVCTATVYYIRQFGPGRPVRPVLQPYSNILPSTMYSHLLLLLLSTSTVFRIAESCSSRSTPKPRPTSPTMRPNITFQTYACPEAYAKWYCLNGATCFAVKIRDSILYNCECADGYMGQRCEFKDLDGSYLPSRERVMIETASIAGGVTIAVLLVVLFSLTLYIHIRRRRREREFYPYYPDLVDRNCSKSYAVKAPPPQAQHRLYPPCPPMNPELWQHSERMSPAHLPGRMEPSIATVYPGSFP